MCTCSPYFLDPTDGSFGDFLEVAASQSRRTAFARSPKRLACDGLSRSTSSALLTTAIEEAGRTVGRPQIADALVARRSCADRDDAFERLLGIGSAGVRATTRAVT